MQRGEIKALVSTAAYFGPSEQAARRRIAEVFKATADGHDVACANGVPEGELKRFNGAFDGLRAEAMQQ